MSGSKPYIIGMNQAKKSERFACRVPGSAAGPPAPPSAASEPEAALT